MKLRINKLHQFKAEPEWHIFNGEVSHMQTNIFIYLIYVFINHHFIILKYSYLLLQTAW